MNSSSESSSKCPFSCPIVQKICCALGLIALIAAFVIWFTAPAKPMEFVAHRERMAIFVLVLANILKMIGKPGCKCVSKDGSCGSGADKK